MQMKSSNLYAEHYSTGFIVPKQPGILFKNKLPKTLRIVLHLLNTGQWASSIDRSDTNLYVHIHLYNRKT